MKWRALSTPIKVASGGFVAAGVLHLVLNLIEGDYPPLAIVFEGALVSFGLLAMTQRPWLVGLVTLIALAFAVVTIFGLSEETGTDLAAGAAFAFLLIVATVAGGYAVIRSGTKPNSA